MIPVIDGGSVLRFMRSRLLPVILALAYCLVRPGGGALLSAQATQGALRIVVIEGEDAVNIVQQKTAVAPVVEVRDRNDQPVAGAVVTFLIGGNRATFANGLKSLTMTTDGAGRAVMSGLNPVGRGTVQISVRAAFQGQTATAAITQTNVLTATAASGSAGGAAAGGGVATGAAAGGAVAGGAAAAGAGTGGLSVGAITAIVGGIGAGAATTVVVVQDSLESGSSSSSPTISVSPSGIGIQSVTVYTFTAAGDAAPNATYTWDFGDGSTASGNSVTHLFHTEGTFQVRVTADASGQSATATTSVILVTLSGTWRQASNGGGSFQELSINQTGTTLTGQWFHTCTGDPDFPGVTQCTVNSVAPLSGSVTAPNAITVSQDGECLNLLATATLNSDGTQFAGTIVTRNPGCIPRPPANTTGMYQATFQRR